MTNLEHQIEVAKYWVGSWTQELDALRKRITVAESKLKECTEKLAELESQV